MTSSPMLMEGAEVFTADGDKLGIVGEVRSGYFKVDAAMMPDYWLPVSYVSAATPGRVELTFIKDSLDDYKMDRPEAA
jgi:hypothetical protein